MSTSTYAWKRKRTAAAPKPTKAEAIRRKMARKPKSERTLTAADMDALGQLFRAELAQMLTPSRPVILYNMRRPGGCG